ncbi:MAG: DNA-methyltransferase [Promethearchaeota archaeon]|jgi:DNA modification methylase
METIHRVYLKNSSDMCEIESGSVDLVITSPPYPMIEMWDLHFSSLNKDIKQALEEEESIRAFNLMHKELDKVWKEVSRVLKKGGIACVNIGDATRKIGKNFQLFPNHVKTINTFLNNEFVELPCILWRKPTNSPNKFLGSGMLPPNAYVTLEHEYILIFRKGGTKQAIAPKSEKRYNSAFFWEERNKWFSDIWEDIRGISQTLNKNNTNHNKLRERTAAYPIELPYRLINMFSIYGDLILDPFWGTGTTSLAAMISTRNSIGYEINPEFIDVFRRSLKELKQLNSDINNKRLNQHVKYIRNYRNNVKEVKYNSNHYKFPVVTKQEIDILLHLIKSFHENRYEFLVNHEKFNYDYIEDR